MRRRWLIAVTSIAGLFAAQDARAQSEIMWRNYEPEPRVFARDSTTCRASARPGVDTTISPVVRSALDACVTALGWRSIQRVTIAPRYRCDAALVAGIGPDTSLVTALRDAFARRFRPPSADVPPAQYEISAAPTGLAVGAPGAASNGEGSSLLPETIRDVEYDIAPRLVTLRAGEVQSYLVTLRARCVSEFPYSIEEMAALAGSGSSPVYFEYQVEKQAIGKPGSIHPSYPRALRDADIPGEVLAQFVVDTKGRAEPGTLKILVATHEDFTEAVRKALPYMRFLPAEIHGTMVRQLVQQPFTFAIAR